MSEREELAEVVLEHTLSASAKPDLVIDGLEVADAVLAHLRERGWLEPRLAKVAETTWQIEKAGREQAERALARLRQVVACACGHDGKLTSEDCPLHGEKDPPFNLCRTQLHAAERVNQQLKAGSPEIRDFVAGVIREAEHQRVRWGQEHDAEKSPEDWLWLVGYLCTKATQAARYGDPEKYLHHIVTTAAACANWHAQALTPARPTPPAIAHQRDGTGAYTRIEGTATGPEPEAGPTP